MAPRKPIPDKIQQRIFDRSRRRCALCLHFDDDRSRKAGQLAHLDRDPANFEEDNLVYLCLQHHDEYDTKRRLTKNLTIAEVKKARCRLYALIEDGVLPRSIGANNTSQPDRFEVLSKIYDHLYEACELFKGATRLARLKCEAPPEDYVRECDGKLVSAQNALARDRLTIPAEFIVLCERFFMKINEGLQNFAMARNPSVPDGLQRAGFWEKASTIAYTEAPSILEKIEEMGRSKLSG